MPCHSSPRPESRSCSRDAIKYADEGGVENIKDVFHASNRGPQIPTLGTRDFSGLRLASRFVHHRPTLVRPKAEDTSGEGHF